MSEFILLVFAVILGNIIGYHLFISASAALYMRKAKVKGFRYRISTYRTFKVIFHIISKSPFSELPPFEDFKLFIKDGCDKRTDNCSKKSE